MERNGACVDCSCVIPKLRLMAMPNALRCLECQEKYEHLQKVVYRLVHS
ncbi:TraR/DksA C4-type zinc finger protein [Escherichia coli]